MAGVILPLRDSGTHIGTLAPGSGDVFHGAVDVEEQMSGQQPPKSPTMPSVLWEAEQPGNE